MESSQKQKGTDQKYIESLRMTKGGAAHNVQRPPLSSFRAQEIVSKWRKFFCSGQILC